MIAASTMALVKMPTTAAEWWIASKKAARGAAPEGSSGSGLAIVTPGRRTSNGFSGCGRARICASARLAAARIAVLHSARNSPSAGAMKGDEPR
jgi:hypothetical protein